MRMGAQVLGQVGGGEQDQISSGFFPSPSTLLGLESTC